METGTHNKTDSKALSIKSLCINQIQEAANRTHNKTAIRQDAGQDKKTTRQNVQDNKTLFKSKIEEIRQEFTGQKNSNPTLQKARPAWLDEGVPEDAVIVFPSRVHEPDLQGFDCASETLPYHLQIFGYWGFGLAMDKLGPVILTKPQSSPNRQHVEFWLYHCWDQIKAEYLAWTQTRQKTLPC